MLFLAETVFTTYSLRHHHAGMHAPRRVLRVSVRRICPERRVAIGFQGSGSVSAPSIFIAPCRATLVASVAEAVQPYAASVAVAAFSHAAAATQPLSLRLAHPRGCRRAQVALRCTSPSLPHAPALFVAQLLVHGPLPNPRWSGQAGSNVPQSTIVAACRSPIRWASKESAC